MCHFYRKWNNKTEIGRKALLVSDRQVCYGLGTRLIYLGVGRRYEAGICTIVISMNGAFQ